MTPRERSGDDGARLQVGADLALDALQRVVDGLGVALQASPTCS